MSKKGFAKAASLGSYHQPKRTQGDYRSFLRGPHWARLLDAQHHLLYDRATKHLFVYRGVALLSRLIDQPITIASDRHGLPLRFFWHANWRDIIQIHETWRDTGCWWEGEGEKAFYLLQTSDGGTFELYFDLQAKSWYLYRVLD
jgi:hypothetical protein